MGFTTVRNRELSQLCFKILQDPAASQALPVKTFTQNTLTWTKGLNKIHLAALETWT